MFIGAYAPERTYPMSAVNRISAAFLYFFRQESAGGILLLLCAVIAMILANSPLAGWYEHLLHMTVPVPGLSMSLLHWILSLIHI